MQPLQLHCITGNVNLQGSDCATDSATADVVVQQCLGKAA